MATKREQIMTALLTKVKTVHRYAVRNHPRLVYEDLPACAVWDESRSVVDRMYNQALNQLTVNIDAAQKLTASQNPSIVGGQMLGVLIDALESGDTTLGGLCESMVVTTDQIIYPESGDYVLAVRVVLDIKYKTVRGE